MWTQIVGKIRLVQSPWVNHSWNATLYVTSRGLTTSPIPYGARTFEVEFDFLDHQLTVRSGDGRAGGLPLVPQSVAAFYNRLSQEMNRLDLAIEIHKKPNELPSQSDSTVMKQFRGRFIGKCSPVHLFWGALDLAVTRFSGRRAPDTPRWHT
jgi:hypothetical protein